MYTISRNLKQEPKQKAKRDKSGNKNRTSTSRCQPAASSQDSLHSRCTTGKNRNTARDNCGKRRTTRNNDEQQGTTTNNALPYPSDSPLLSSAVALSLTSHSMATSASSSRSWMLCASRETPRFPTSIVGRRGIAGRKSEEV